MFPEVTIGLVRPYNVAFGEEYWTSNKRSSRCGRLTLHPKLQDHATINIGVLMAGSYVKPIPREEVETTTLLSPRISRLYELLAAFLLLPVSVVFGETPSESGPL